MALLCICAHVHVRVIKVPLVALTISSVNSLCFSVYDDVIVIDDDIF